MTENGGPQRRPLFAGQLIPTGTAVLGGKEERLGDVAILHLVWPEGQLQVILDPNSADRVGDELKAMAAQVRSGLVTAAPADVEKIAEGLRPKPPDDG